MRKILSMIRLDAFTRASYRVRVLSSIVGLFAMLIPVYFVTAALDPMMRNSIAGQGRNYFAFVLTGLIVLRYCDTTVNALPRAVDSAIRTGTLEALFATPTAPIVIFLGMIGFQFLWTTGEALILLTAGAVLGAHISILHLAAGGFILGLLLLTYFAFGLLGVAFILEFRTTGPILTGVVTLSILLGGVYYPTHAIPARFQFLAAAVPMTYGLRALREVTLTGQSLEAVASDLGILCIFLGVLLPGSWILVRRALLRARKTGSLAQY